MSYIKEQVAYIRGLADGLNIGDESKEARVMQAIIALLDDMASAVDENKSGIEDLNEGFDALSEDCRDLYDFIFDADDDNDADDDFDYDADDYGEDELDDGDEDSFQELTCRYCFRPILADKVPVESNAELICPSCGKKMRVKE